MHLIKKIETDISFVYTISYVYNIYLIFSASCGEKKRLKLIYFKLIRYFLEVRFLLILVLINISTNII